MNRSLVDVGLLLKQLKDLVCRHRRRPLQQIMSASDLRSHQAQRTSRVRTTNYYRPFALRTSSAIAINRAWKLRNRESLQTRSTPALRAHRRRGRRAGMSTAPAPSRGFAVRRCSSTNLTITSAPAATEAPTTIPTTRRPFCAPAIGRELRAPGATDPSNGSARPRSRRSVNGPSTDAQLNCRASLGRTSGRTRMHQSACKREIRASRPQIPTIAFAFRRAAGRRLVWRRRSAPPNRHRTRASPCDRQARRGDAT